MKNPLTPAGIEPATFRFAAQHLNHCATAVPAVHFGSHTKHTHTHTHTHHPRWRSQYSDFVMGWKTLHFYPGSTNLIFLLQNAQTESEAHPARY